MFLLPARKDEPSKVYESFPIRVEQHKVAVQHRRLGETSREEAAKLAGVEV